MAWKPTGIDAAHPEPSFDGGEHPLPGLRRQLLQNGRQPKDPGRSRSCIMERGEQVSAQRSLILCPRPSIKASNCVNALVSQTSCTSFGSPLSRAQRLNRESPASRKTGSAVPYPCAFTWSKAACALRRPLISALRRAASAGRDSVGFTYSPPFRFILPDAFEKP